MVTHVHPQRRAFELCALELLAPVVTVDSPCNTHCRICRPSVMTIIQYFVAIHTLRIHGCRRCPHNATLASEGSQLYRNLFLLRREATSGMWRHFDFVANSGGNSGKMWPGNRFAIVWTWFNRIDFAPSLNFTQPKKIAMSRWKAE